LEHYLRHFNERYERKMSWGLETLDLLCEYAWPGNIRELINLVERLVVVCESDTIEALDLPEKSSTSTMIAQVMIVYRTRKVVENAERSAILSAMRVHKTTRLAAKALGVSQATIVQKMKRWESFD
jgi:transcriptional regulator with PAS, ATPase and Fis domain